MPDAVCPLPCLPPLQMACIDVCACMFQQPAIRLFCRRCRPAHAPLASCTVREQQPCRSGPAHCFARFAPVHRTADGRRATGMGRCCCCSIRMATGSQKSVSLCALCHMPKHRSSGGRTGAFSLSVCRCLRQCSSGWARARNYPLSQVAQTCLSPSTWAARLLRERADGPRARVGLSHPHRCHLRGGGG